MEKERKMSGGGEVFEGSSSSSESETSSSDDEVASNVSITKGFNPCKCCICEDCDLRNHCIVIGITEILFWLLYLLLIFFIGLLSRGSEPMIYVENGTEPAYGRNKILTETSTKLTLTVKPGGGPAAGRRSMGGNVNLRDRSILTDRPLIGNEERASGLNSTNGSDTNGTYELFLRSQFGDAALLFKPSGDEGVNKWEENMNRFYLILVGLSSAIVFFSILSGTFCLNGAYYRQKGLLIGHSVMAVMTACLVLGFAGIWAMIDAFTPFIFFTIIFFFYIYFALCSYGLFTMIRRGVYDDFIVEGITYTYSTVLRAKVRINKYGDTTAGQSRKT